MKELAIEFDGTGQEVGDVTDRLIVEERQMKREVCPGICPGICPLRLVP